jgi:hypothetical protein
MWAFRETISVRGRYRSVTVISRAKLGAGRVRRRREAGTDRAARRGRVPSRADSTAAKATTGTTPPKRRREAGAPEDLAVYRCACGFVFEAQVSTSVGCPHCGGTQAW